MLLSMNKRSTYIAILGLSLLILNACAPPPVTNTVKKVVDLSFQDDASKYRPTMDLKEIDPVEDREVIENKAIDGAFNIDEELGAIVDSMYVRNDTIRQFDGFTILGS